MLQTAVAVPCVLDDYMTTCIAGCGPVVVDVRYTACGPVLWSMRTGHAKAGSG